MRSFLFVAGLLAGILGCKTRSVANEPHKSVGSRIQDQREIRRLGHLGGQDAVNKLSGFLSDAVIRDQAIWYLGRMGPAASAALPSLQPIADFERKHGTNHFAAEAIERIQGCASEEDSAPAWSYRVVRGDNQIMPPIGFIGDISSIVSDKVLLVDNESDWNEAWKRHGGHPTCQPVVDFSKTVMLLIFGEMNDGFLSHVETSAKNGNLDVTLRVGHSDASVGGMIEPDPHPLGGPFLFLEVERPRSRLRLLRDEFYAMTAVQHRVTVLADFDNNQRVGIK